jgi:hypothetical protein
MSFPGHPERNGRWTKVNYLETNWRTNAPARSHVGVEAGRGAARAQMLAPTRTARVTVRHVGRSVTATAR